MKTSKVDKIRNYFTEIKTEAVFTALKEKNTLALPGLKLINFYKNMIVTKF